MLISTTRIALAIFSLLSLSSCFPFDGPRPKEDLVFPDRELVENSEATSTPTSYPKEIDKCIDPSPSLSDTDCTTWSFLHSLIMVANNMENEGEMVDLTKVELDGLEKEIYPDFVQAQLNCGQWVEPINDYEPISDVLLMLTFLGVETYDYNSSKLIEFLLRGAAQDEFASSAEEIGCVKSLFLLFVTYEGE